MAVHRASLSFYPLVGLKVEKVTGGKNGGLSLLQRRVKSHDRSALGCATCSIPDWSERTVKQCSPSPEATALNDHGARRESHESHHSLFCGDT